MSVEFQHESGPKMRQRNLTLLGQALFAFGFVQLLGNVVLPSPAGPFMAARISLFMITTVAFLIVLLTQCFHELRKVRPRRLVGPILVGLYWLVVLVFVSIVGKAGQLVLSLWTQ